MDNKKATLVLMPIVIGMIGTLMLSGCGNKVKQVVDEEITTDTASMASKVQLDEIMVNIPSPMELTKELSKAGYSYNKGLLNSSGKAGSYSTNLKAASNLGIYGADLGYTASYGQTQDVVGYLNVIKQLSDKVGVGKAFDETTIKKFEANLGKKDSLEVLINAAYEKANRNLRSNQRVSTSAVIVAGGWIEGLYLATQIVANTPQNEKNEDVYLRIWNQMYSFQYVMALLSQYKNNADCAQMLKDIAEIQQLLTEFSGRNRLTNEDVARINAKVTPLRNQLVN